MQTLIQKPPFTELLSRSWRKVTSLRASSKVDYPNQSRGGLPRFHSEVLPPSKGNVVRVQGEEFWHMTKVLRLKVDDKVELFNGFGAVIEGCIQKIDKTGADFMALEDPKIVLAKNTQWHVFAAFGTLKGGRADWLVEKCTELGASSLTPLLTERSPSISENRVDRLQRVILAAIAQSKLSLLAAAEATSLVSTLSNKQVAASGMIIVGPEGDFTEKEVKMMTEAGAIPVGLGPHRLRVETATMALLATVMLWSDSQQPVDS
ncbi:hypothetical protein C5167_024545 [Papaver somniferum]|uniref:16S rRNA (uracil(1498)-N(3))-methyltransferase n=1 Tax=Papaver somniferum TaxID=3469 RepID=A0A4Y7JS81_PAPSO|nr:hypothetical protein C5167_024545 [Papaver somniferum]